MASIHIPAVPAPAATPRGAIEWAKHGITANAIVFLVIIVIDTTASDPSRQPCQPYPLRYVAVDADLVGVGWVGLTIGY